MTRVGWAILATLASGCAAPAAGPVKGSGQGSSSIELRGSGSIVTPPKPDPVAARHAIPTALILDVYHLTVPAGAVSRNDEFWKHVDESRIDVATYDLLFKNGVRVGLARDIDWGYFKGLLGQYPSARQQQVRTEPGKLGYFELPIRTGVPYQNLFWLDDRDGLVARTFERCDDLLAVSFEASTHRPGEAFVKLCPLVRGLRRQFHVSVMNNEEIEIDQKHPEQLYDLRLESVIPLNDFLIVGPSRQAKLPTSIGNTFLVTDGKTEPTEHVLVIVPRVFRIDDPALAEPTSTPRK